MKALVLEDYDRLAYVDMSRPDVESEDVLVQVRACGICGSDVHGMDGSTGRRRPPIVMGHEASGVIAEVGSRVTGWAVGDRVTFDSTVYCGKCTFCRKGDINLCDDRRVLGVSCEDYRRNGAFAEYVSVPQRILYRLPDSLSFENAALVEPLSIALHGVERAGVAFNDFAVVVGAGMVGLLVVQSLRAAGCGTIVAVDLEPAKLKLAVKLGADCGLNPRTSDVGAEIQRLTGGKGADVAMEVVGIAASVDLAVNSLRKGGKLALIGNLTPRVELPLQTVVTRELTLYGSCASRGDYPACLDLIARGTIAVDPLISQTAPLSEGAEWFARLKRGDSGLMKVLLTP